MCFWLFGKKEKLLTIKFKDMYPASLIAQEFVKRGIKEGQFVTQMKVQKMVFFAHGYHLAIYNKPLINENFEAWKYGPVVKSIYDDLKFYGSGLITDCDHFQSLDPKRSYELTYSAKDSIDYTWEMMKNFTASALSNWTHQVGSPWDMAYNTKRNVPIDDKVICAYFEELLTIKE